MKTTSLTLALLAFTFSFSYSHNIWMETSATGQSGKAQAVRVFLGGYGENERDATKNWFSNTREFTLWLVTPDGIKKQLATRPAVNYFEAVFTPDKNGYYTLLISHEVAEVFGTTRYHYFSAAQVSVGNSQSGKDNLGKYSDFSIQLQNSPEVSKPVTLLVQYKEKNLDKGKAVINAPSGWNKNLEVRQGNTAFDAAWPGLYVAEVFYSEKKEGSWNGKEFKKIQYVSTYSFTGIK